MFVITSYGELRLVDQPRFLIINASMNCYVWLELLLALLAASIVRAKPALMLPNSTTVNAATGDPAVIGDARNMPSLGWMPFNPMQYSEGYVLGELTGVHTDRYIIQTLEGFVKVGEASTQGGYVNHRCYSMAVSRLKHGPNYPAEEQAAQEDCMVQLNPWPFSSLNTGLINELSSVGTSEVVLYYKSFFWVPFTRSNNYVEKVYLVDPKVLPPHASYDVGIPLIAHVPRLIKGFYVGRVVQASLDNVVRKARQVIIQQGVGGAIYSQVSVADDHLFDFIVKAMASGRYMRLYYYYLMEGFAFPDNLTRGYKTNIRAYKVELLN